jgi:2-polyprenyl-3-methyl-5-hydroxy-6-metoxy-1,4-benzoquinol methylase
MRVSPEVELPVAVQPCPLCGGLDFEKLAIHDRHLLGLVTVGCRQCGLIQTNPRPDASGLADFYAHHYRKLYQGVVDPSREYVTQYRKDERLRYTTRHLLSVLSIDEHSTVLDYGCGEGSLFAALRGAGFRGRLIGVEPNVNFARYAAQVGQAEVLPTLEGVEQIDAVLVNHVLEHLADPVGVLTELGRRLERDGRLYVDVPNADAYDHVGALHLAHIVHFTQRTLQALVARAGFDVMHCEAHEPPHHPRSLRLLARPRALALPDRVSVDARDEVRTWQHLRQLEARSWRWTWTRRLSRIGLLRSAYHAMRRLTHADAR